MKKLSRFGRFVRIRRIEKSVLLYEMAEVLGVSSAMLSGVETGRKKFPPDWESEIIEFLELNESEREELRSALLSDKSNNNSSVVSNNEIPYYVASRKSKHDRDAA